MNLSYLALFFVCFTVISTYTPSTALELAYFCGSATQNSTDITNWNCSYCLKYQMSDVKTFNNNIAQIFGFVGYSSTLKSIVVTFRSSQNLKNWIVNAVTTLNPYLHCSKCKVHTGFDAGYNMVKGQVRTLVKDLIKRYPDAKVIINGHSLGGALAILASVDLKLHLGKVDSVYTFGQPRVGNSQFASFYDNTISQTFRIIDYADLVPHLPPAKFGFRHSSNQIWYERGMQNYKTCQGQSNGCANSLSLLKYSTSDHSLQNYLKLKTQFLQKQSIWQSLQKYLRKVFKTELSQVDMEIQARKVEQAINQLKSSISNQQDLQQWQIQQARKVEQFRQKLKLQIAIDQSQ